MKGLYWWVAFPMNLAIYLLSAELFKFLGGSGVMFYVGFLVFGTAIALPLSVMVRRKLGPDVRLTIRDWKLFWWKQWVDSDGFATKIWYRNRAWIGHTRWAEDKYPDVDEMISEALR